jgi:hypothetical protein
MASQHPETQTTPTTKDSTKPLPIVTSRLQCFRCGTEGHRLFDCPLQKASRAATNTTNGMMMTPREEDEKNVCFHCGQPGHERKACPDMRCFICQQRGHGYAQCPIKLRRTTRQQKQQQINKNANNIVSKLPRHHHQQQMRDVVDGSDDSNNQSPMYMVHPLSNASDSPSDSPFSHHLLTPPPSAACPQQPSRAGSVTTRNTASFEVHFATTRMIPFLGDLFN